jgi:hypothetical protein
MRILQPRLAALMTSAALLAGAHANAGTGSLPFEVTYESEAPGIEYSTSTFAVSGVENFDTLTASGPENNTSSNGVAASALTFTTDFGLPGQITGTYNNVQIASYGTYGGAGGAGNFAVAPQYTSYALTLDANPADFKDGVTYFGYWLSALDAGNYVTFYDGSTRLFTFDPADVIAAVNASADSGEYYGNPNYNANDPNYGQGNDGGEPYIFLNFYATGGTQFTKVVFSQLGSGGYESDNDTVGEWTSMSGTTVPLTHSANSNPALPPVPGVPEPSAWVLMIVGVGSLGAVLRRRRQAGLVAA